MAKNLKEYELSIETAVVSGVVSGDPVVTGIQPGVALYDRDSDGNAVVDFRSHVWNLLVHADDGGATTIAVGDAIYYTVGDTPKLSKKASGVFFGIALEVNAGSGTEAVIKVLMNGGRVSTAKTNHARAYAKLDLSGAAQADVPILHVSSACTLVKALLLYTEASSADAGAVVEIGKEGTAAYYYTGTSEVSKSAWYELDVTLLQTTIAAGNTVVCGHAGSKVGTGEILVCIEYTVN